MLVQVVKSHSSKWIKTKGREFSKFYWQDGYAAFSVYPAEIEVVRRYIANQKQHHGKKSFQKEYVEFLEKNEMEYDEKYVWG